MKRNYWLLLIILLSVSNVFGQTEELTVLIKDVKNKPVKNYTVTLGQTNPITVKTDKSGMFTIPNANLQETLYITLKDEKESIQIPINGYKYLKIQPLSENFHTEYMNEPSDEILKIINRQKKMTYSSTMYRSDIESSGCQDFNCILSRMKVRMSSDGRHVIIRGSLSLNSNSGSLLVVNGIAYEDASALRTFTLNDIEEITVLKDASEYGVRGAEGALIIKTRMK